MREFSPQVRVSPGVEGVGQKTGHLTSHGVFLPRQSPLKWGVQRLRRLNPVGLPASHISLVCSCNVNIFFKGSNSPFCLWGQISYSSVLLQPI